MDTPESLLEKARTLESSGQDQAALDLYARVAAASAEPDPAVLLRVGNLQLRLGKPEEAAESLSRSAELLAAAGLRNNAIAVLRRVRRIHPDSAPAVLRLAELNAREGYAREARDELARFVERREGAGDPDAGLEALRAHLAAFPGDDAVRRLLAERLQAHGRAEEAREVSAATASPAPAPPAEPPPPAPREEEGLEVLGSGWEGADLPAPEETPSGPEIELLPTRIEEEAPPESEVAPLAGLEPTLLEGLEPTSLEPEERPEEPPPGDDEPLALLGSEAEPEWGLDTPASGGEELPLLGAEPSTDELEALMRRVEEAVREGDEGRTVEALLALGRHLGGAGQAERAREVFERVLELVPDHEEARRALDDLRAR